MSTVVSRHRPAGHARGLVNHNDPTHPFCVSVDSRGLKALCFDRDLQVLILNVVRGVKFGGLGAEYSQERRVLRRRCGRRFGRESIVHAEA